MVHFPYLYILGFLLFNESCLIKIVRLLKKWLLLLSFVFMQKAGMSKKMIEELIA